MAFPLIFIPGGAFVVFFHQHSADSGWVNKKTYHKYEKVVKSVVKSPQN